MLSNLDVAFSYSYLNFFHFQFYCSKDKEYNDLATIFFNTQVFLYFWKPYSFKVYMATFMLCLYGVQFNGICLCWYRMMP
jgi:hypothetical protein